MNFEQLNRAVKFGAGETGNPTHYTVFSTSRGRTWTEEPRRKRDRKPLQLHEALDLADTLQQNAQIRGGGNGHQTWIGSVYSDGSKRVWPLSPSPENATYILDDRNNESPVTGYYDRPQLEGLRVPLDADHHTLDSYGYITPQFAHERLITHLHQMTGHGSRLVESMKAKGLGWDSDFWQTARPLIAEGTKGDYTSWLALADLIDEHDVNSHVSSHIRKRVADHQDGRFPRLQLNNF